MRLTCIAMFTLNNENKSQMCKFVKQFFLYGTFCWKNRQKPTATLIYTNNIQYIHSYIPPPVINTFSDAKIH